MVEGFLKLRVRSAFAAWLFGAMLGVLLGLLAPVCVGQNQPAENDPEPPRSQPQPGQTQGQPSQTQPGQSQQNQGQPGQPQTGQGTPQNVQPPAGQSGRNQSQHTQPPQNAVQPNESSSKQAEPEETAPDQPVPGQSPAKQAAPEQTPSQQNPSDSSSGQSTPGQSTSRESAPRSTPPSQLAPISGNQIPIRLDTNETIFSALAALNSCGYDQDLAISDPIRSRVRAEVQRNLAESADARSAQSAVCDFYERHVASKDQNRNLSQYISLALYMDGAPHFMPRTKEEDLPPDAGMISDFGAVLERFYATAGLHGIWERHRNDYAAAMRRYHAPLAKMVFDTEVYLKQPSAQYLGRTFTVYLDFMGSPNETDARNYGAAYYVIVFPAPTTQGASAEAGLKMDQIRHTFLHYELDPLAEKHFTSIKRLEPLLQSVKRAPLEESFKNDISLLVTECLVRAIEIRMTGSKTEEAMRAQAVDDAVKQGYILTRHFYNAVVAFEKDPAGIRGEYGGIVDAVDVRKEEKAAAEVQFASAAAPELVRLSRPEERRLLITAEKRLAAGDLKGAQELAQAALDKKIGDQGRALFILAEVAVASKNRDGAQDNFQKAIAASQDPKVVAWSHVYLGRILDMKEDREAAVEQYRAALNAGATLPEIKAAAERGLAQAYEPPTKPQPQ
jgi:tetratricopeptide (TPR) repeat protein